MQILLFWCFSVALAFPVSEEIESKLNFNQSENVSLSQAIQKIHELKYKNGRTFGTLTSFALGGLLSALDFVEEVMDDRTNQHEENNAVRQRRQEETTTETPSTTETTTDLTTTEFPTLHNYSTFSILLLNNTNDSINEIDSDRIRIIRDQDVKNEKNSTVQERQEDNDEGGGGGLIGAIISGFLGSLSKPDGGVDIDAVVSVIGSLSAMKEDGTYDFTGLSDTLSAFFGGDDDGGGSDVGSFVGGLAAASISGIASPPGAKGAGSFVGNLLKQVLPALSAPVILYSFLCA